MFDVAIVGGGPAGATLARLIGKSHRVLLLEQRDLLKPFDAGMREKCCGGLLAPDAQHMLARLGLGLPGEVLVGPQLFTVRTVDMMSGEERYYQRHYINMDREKFDRFLFSLVPPGVDARLRCTVKRVKPGRGESTISFRSGGKEFEERARLVVAADGAASICAPRARAGRPAPPRYIAIQEWYETGEMTPYFSVIFDREITDFYCWTIPKGDHLIAGAALTPGRDACRAFDLFGQKLERLGIKRGRVIKRRGGFILRPMGAHQVSFGSASTALIGEAGGFISPTSAEGLSYAFQSAMLLAECLEPFDDRILERYRALGKTTLHRNISLKCVKMPFMYNPLLRKLVMKSGIKSLKLRRPGG